ncbi:recombinase family protein [Streptomyces sp. NPDC058000]|uniref:recombinase family protein n=1 Tax=Streptomyces sp. NPDC058000 TaxID=3346299 RepID=UPI0036E8E37C
MRPARSRPLRQRPPRNPPNARCSTLNQELQSQLDALAKHGIPRDKAFSEKISTRVRVRPQFEAALALTRQIKAHAPHCRVIFTVYEMKRLGRDAAELTALADHLTAHGLALEMPAGPLCQGCTTPAGQAPSVASIYRTLAEHEKKEAYPEAVAAARADFADLQDVDDIPRPRRVRIRRPADALTSEEVTLRQRLQDQILQSAQTE